MEPGASPRFADPFFVRSDGRWFSTPVPGGSPAPCDVGVVIDVLRTLAPMGAIMPDLGEGPQPLPVGDPLVAEGALPWVGRCTEAGLEVGIGDGVRLLGPAHLAVLDQCVGDRTASEVVAACGIDAAEAARALADLLDQGLVAVVDRLEGPAGPAPAADPGAEHHDTHEREVQPTSDAIGPTGSAVPDGPAGRIPVYAPWHDAEGPNLALGMLTAVARHHRGGALERTFEIRRPEHAASFLADVALRPGPAIVLVSNYVWSIDDHLAMLERAVALNPDLFVVHGGPSTPKYEADAASFLRAHRRIAHVLARGEGEHLVVDLLELLARTGLQVDAEEMGAIPGLTFIDPETDEVVRTPDRDRIAVLDDLPSPYLTGEFDHIPIAAWRSSLAIETNRGCPYGCTYCDWGSVTLSRIRKFDIERVRDEIAWAASRGVICIQITDANFGVMARDVETATSIVEARAVSGAPEAVTFCPAKNTTKHLTRIMDVLAAGGVSPVAALGVQSTDPVTLAEVDRSNIAVSSYVRLAAEHRRRGHALQGELLLGLPGQTYDSYRRDLQFMFDHEILVRTWPVQLLPNAPMNEPGYRARHQIEVDEQQLVISTSSFSQADRVRMLRLRKVQMTLEIYALARHVLRWAQWDHGVDATVVMDHLLDVADETPGRIPHLAWALAYFEHHPVAPVTWGRFFDELRTVLVEDFSLEPSSAMDTAFAVNLALLPSAGRTFPETVHLEHDYLTYYRDATRDLDGSGEAALPRMRLEDLGPGTLTVEGDPLGLCTRGLRFAGEAGTQVVQSDFYMATASAYELLSPLMRLLPYVLRALTDEELSLVSDRSRDEVAQPSDPLDVGPVEPVPAGSATPVSLGRRMVGLLERRTAAPPGGI